MESMEMGRGRMNTSSTDIIVYCGKNLVLHGRQEERFCGLIQSDISVWSCSHSKDWSQKYHWRYRMWTETEMVYAFWEQIHLRLLP